MHRAAEQSWADAIEATSKSRSRVRSLNKCARAAVDGAKDDIESWLGLTLLDPPAVTAEFVSTVGDMVATDVFGALCRELGVSNKNNVRVELAGKHLFCQMLAELASAMQQVRDDIDSAVKRVAAALLDYQVGRKNIKIPPSVAHVVADAAAKGVDKVLETMPAVRHFDDLHGAVRILAIMTCPAPEKHEAVIRCALRPLGQPIVSEVVQQRLKTAIPTWMA